jgi:hypothetical protein
MLSKLSICSIIVFVSAHYVYMLPNIQSNTIDDQIKNDDESHIVYAQTNNNGKHNNSVDTQNSVNLETINNQYGVTIINHGWQLSGLSDPFVWMFPMAEAIRTRAGEARILRYNKSNGTFETLMGYDEQGETILLFDWVIESDIVADGFSEAAGDALFAALLFGEQNNDFILGNIHFIGHSRGCSVNSETVERLLATGREVDHVTNLDPHDWGRSSLFSFPTDYDVNDESLVINYPAARIPNSGVVSWEGVGWIDSYWQVEGGLFDPGGREVYGSYSLQLQNIGHSEVHDWYLGTIDNQSGIASWYDDPYPDRNESGFNFSRIGNLPRPTEWGTRQAVAFNFEDDGIINGDFSRGPAINQAQFPGWSEHGGGGDGRFENNWLVLDQTNTIREHNRFYIPDHADKIKFYLKVVIAESSIPPLVDKFQFSIKVIDSEIAYDLLFEEYTNTTFEKWIELDITGYKNSVATILLDLVDGNGNGINSQVEIDSISLSKFPQLIVDISVMLEGSYSNGIMRTSLYDTQTLKLSQPYNISPWNYLGTESVQAIPTNVVDWVLVELRDKTDKTNIIAKRAAFVLNNGKVVDIDGASPIVFWLHADEYYIAVIHRNHLPVMSANPVTISNP